jgi:hypothetical protein
MGQILTDKEKIEKWNDICMTMNWSQPHELETWLQMHGVMFTKSGSCVGVNLVLGGKQISVIGQVEEIVKSSNSEGMATYILQAIAGLLSFKVKPDNTEMLSTTLETMFWKIACERCQLEWELDIPPEIMPKYVREALFPEQFPEGPEKGPTDEVK